MRSGECSVVFATSLLAIGMDVDNIEDVVIFGDPSDTDEMLQMIGRIRPNWQESNVRKPACQGIVYFSPKASKWAEQSLSKQAKSLDKKTAELEESSTDAEMDISLAEVFNAKCIIENIDHQYQNLEQDTPCLCPTCTARPRYKGERSCFCSRCYQDQLPLTCKIPKPRTTLVPTIMMFPPEFYFPNEEIQLVLDNFASLKEAEDIGRLLPLNCQLVAYHQRLFDCLQILGTEFKEIKSAKKERCDEAKKATGEATNVVK
ncbi:hypothetical protein BDP27DRAFT_1428837 [Rhodocollybia butyracea]|uniref:Helicase C-terminal domain-containing protein n=1 Tax=Rhodocollybia butyracea TaxID=206335 RepID=A0A9P5PCX7_9AGAR|nr:hypothetical protein BDP27DRAFT_1428837 [Rhodocollybia butyracea]